MNYPILIIVAIVGIALGMYIALCPSVALCGGGRRKANDGFIAKQSIFKEEE